MNFGLFRKEQKRRNDRGIETVKEVKKMFKVNLLCSLILLVVFSQICFSQQENNFTLFDEFTKPNYEDLAARMDSFAVKINNLSSAKGFIIFSGGRNKIENEFLREAVRRYALKRFEEKKFVFLNSASSQEPVFSLFISEDGSKPQISEESENYTLSENQSSKFVKDSIEIAVIEGKKTFFPAGCDAGCVEWVNFYLLANFTKANPKLNAFIIIKDKNIRKAKETMKLISKEAVNDANISQTQLKFLYGGKNSDETKYPEIEIYLAPDKSKLPKGNYKSFR